MTEDESDGCLYRFSPNNYPDLSQGRLEVASVDWTSGFVSWRTVRLYFSSQRGPFNDGQSVGVTYEVSGPFATFL